MLALVVVAEPDVPDLANHDLPLSRGDMARVALLLAPDMHALLRGLRICAPTRRWRRTRSHGRVQVLSATGQLAADPLLLLFGDVAVTPQDKIYECRDRISTFIFCHEKQSPPLDSQGLLSRDLGEVCLRARL